MQPQFALAAGWLHSPFSVKQSTMNQSPKGYKYHGLTKAAMKQIKGGGGVTPAKCWYCPTNPIECGAPQAQCNANCP